MKYEKKSKKEAIKKAIRRIRDGEKEWKGKTTNLKMGWKDWGIKTIPKASAKGLPTIKILAERKVTMVELDLDIPNSIAEDMVRYGADHIINDRNTLINWTFNRGLENFVNLLSKKPLK